MIASASNLTDVASLQADLAGFASQAERGNRKLRGAAGEHVVDFVLRTLPYSPARLPTIPRWVASEV